MAEAKKKKEDEISIEEIFKELDEMVEKLESPDTSLEDSFATYQKGMDLLKKSNEKIDRVEKKMMQMDEDGTLREF